MTTGFTTLLMCNSRPPKVWFGWPLHCRRYHFKRSFTLTLTTFIPVITIWLSVGGCQHVLLGCMRKWKMDLHVYILCRLPTTLQFMSWYTHSRQWTVVWKTSLEKHALKTPHCYTWASTVQLLNLGAGELQDQLTVKCWMLLGWTEARWLTGSPRPNARRRLPSGRNWWSSYTLPTVAALGVCLCDDFHYLLCDCHCSRNLPGNAMCSGF